MGEGARAPCVPLCTALLVLLHCCPAKLCCPAGSAVSAVLLAL